MPALFVVAALAELISGNSGPVDVDMVEIIAGIVTMGIFVLMGIGLKKLGRKVALNKQKKEMEMYGYQEVGNVNRYSLYRLGDSVDAVTNPILLR